MADSDTTPLSQIGAPVSGAVDQSSPSNVEGTNALLLNQVLGKLVDGSGTNSAAVVTAIQSVTSAVSASLIGGTTGADANRLLRSKGTGGFALQPGLISEDDSGNLSGINNLSMALSPYAVVCGGTTNPGNLQSIASVGTAGVPLVSNGPGALPTFGPFIDGIGGPIPFPINSTIRFWLASPFAFTITSTTTRCASGTCTATWNVNGVTIPGGSNSVSTTQQAISRTSGNTVSVGQYVELVITSVSGCQGLSFMLAITRA